MCGIAGILSFDADPDRLTPDRLDAMGRALVHRGPDGAGLYRDHLSTIGLVHRRLSIIDVAGGAQPIANEDGTIRVILNGEIFNYVELRRELIGRGHVFRTQSDTEVIAHLYEERGDDFVHALNGQFAIAIWDARAGRLLLVRDRPGILPLYVCERAGELLFGSEIKAILAALPAPPRANVEALRDVLTFWAPLSPATMFEGITEVEPGQMVAVSRDGVIARSFYWRWTLPQDTTTAARRDADLVDELRGLLMDATRLRLRSDVPVGALLSGGIDSSFITALVTSVAGGTRTFSVGFDDPGLDESRFQNVMARATGMPHGRFVCTRQDIGRRFVDVVRAVETPITRTGPVPVHVLAQGVRESDCKVVLTGEGADEVFGGYDLFTEARVRAFCGRQPASAARRRLLTRLYPTLEFARAQTPEALAAYFAPPAREAGDPLFSHRTRWAAGAFLEQFLSADVRAALGSSSPADRVSDRFRGELEGRPLLHRAQVLEARTFMAPYLLSSQSDRMLMAHSVEGRFPYLDHRVIEFGNGLPPTIKMRGLREKIALKKAAAGWVPDAIVRRPKQPYRGPDATVFAGDGAPEYARALMTPRAVRDAGYFDPGRVTHLARKVETSARSGRPITHRESLAFLTILSTQIWHALFQNAAGVAGL